MLSRLPESRGVMSRRSGGLADLLLVGSVAASIRTIPELSVLRSTVRGDEITSEMEPNMIVDCDRCEVRGDACKDCVITVLLGAPPGGVELDGTERWALGTLAEAGIVPRLQLVDRHASQATSQAGADCGNHLRDTAERSVNDGERSQRNAS